STSTSTTGRCWAGTWSARAITASTTRPIPRNRTRTSGSSSAAGTTSSAPPTPTSRGPWPSGCARSRSPTPSRASSSSPSSWSRAACALAAAPGRGPRSRPPTEPALMPNEARLQAFLARALYDLGAAQSAWLVALGDRLGLYKAMAGAGPLTPRQLAERTGASEACLREWLANQACGGYVEYDAPSGTFTLPEEQALALAADDSPASMAGAFRVAAALGAAQEPLLAAFRTGA